MHPQTTWTRLLDAVATRDWDQAEQLANTLLRWLRDRGPPPQTVGRNGLTRGWHAAVAQLVCYMAINSASDVRRRARRQRKSKRRNSQ